MSTESLMLSFSLPSAQSSTSLDCPTVLKQEESDVGRITKNDIIKALEEQLFNGPALDINCGVTDDNEYSSVLNIYPSTSQIGEVGVTHGNIDQTAILEIITETETVTFELDTEKTTDYPIKRVISYEWQGTTWSEEGGIVTPPPTITVSGNTITVSEKVYGTVLIKYETERYSNALTIPARDDSSGTAFNSVAWVIKDCGVEILVLDPPPNAEDNLSNLTDCLGFGTEADFEDDDGLDYPEARPVDQHIRIDYCSQEEETSYYE